jgi:hypothetical protein
MNELVDNPYKAPEANLVQSTNDKGILEFKRFSAWGVLGLTIITLGIYPCYWMYSRTVTINSLHESTIPLVLPISLFCLAILSFASDLFGESEAATIAGLVILLVYFVLYLVVLFKIRNRLQSIINRSSNKQYKLGIVLTFFFYVIYLQYKINEYIDELQPGR